MSIDLEQIKSMGTLREQLLAFSEFLTTARPDNRNDFAMALQTSVMLQVMTLEAVAEQTGQPLSVVEKWHAGEAVPYPGHCVVFYRKLLGMVGRFLANPVLLPLVPTPPLSSSAAALKEACHVIPFPK